METNHEEILKKYNEWRRGGEGPQPNPTEIGIAIDAVLAGNKSLEDRLAKMTAEFERVASYLTGSEAEFLIHGVLSKLKTDDQNLVVLRGMPKLRTGWKYRGEYRQPRDGEYYLFMGEVKFCRGRTAGWYPIVVYVGAE